MNKHELQEEYQYRYDERLGIFCGNNEPTVEQKAIATEEAEQWLEEEMERSQMPG